jgi:methionine aminopeptidase
MFTKLFLFLFLSIQLFSSDNLNLSDIVNKKIINFKTNKQLYKLNKSKYIMISYFSTENKEEAKILKKMFKKLNLNSKNYNNIFHSYAIINLKSSYIPIFMIKYKLKNLIKKSNNFTYLYDDYEYLLNKWSLKNKKYNLLLFKNKKLIYKSFNKLNNDNISDIEMLLQIKN